MKAAKKKKAGKMKTLNYWVENKLVQHDNKEVQHSIISADYEKEQALELLSNQIAWDYHPATRNAHFTALNCLPVVSGTKWAVTENIYLEFLEMLPPITRKAGGFYICEESTQGLHSAYYQDQNGLYWHVYELINK